MRTAGFVLLCGAAVLGCSDPNSEILPVQVQWMEWPAEVLAATPFTVRIVGTGDYCRELLDFKPGVSVDQSAVTFEPFFLVGDHDQPCWLYDHTAGQPVMLRPQGVIQPFFDTRALVPGLATVTPRTYEIRAASEVAAAIPADAASLPVRTFGEVTVRSDSASSAPVNAAGRVYAYRDTLACVHMVPLFLYPGYIVENPPDTAQYWTAFVRGYLHTPAAAVCGEKRVFHVVTVN